MTPEMKAKTAARLLERSEVVETGCRRWMGARTKKGYGHISVSNKHRQVHRVAYEVWVGPIPDGLEIDHVRARGCLHRDCIEPSHLEAVTHHENILRKPIVSPTHCPKGHEYTPANTKICRSSDRPGTRRHCRKCFNADRNAYRARKRAETKGNADVLDSARTEGGQADER